MSGNGNQIRAAAREGRYAKLEHILATNFEGVDECDKNGMAVRIMDRAVLRSRLGNLVPF